MDKVANGLFVGTSEDTEDKSRLLKNGITDRVPNDSTRTIAVELVHVASGPSGGSLLYSYQPSDRNESTVCSSTSCVRYGGASSMTTDPS